MWELPTDFFSGASLKMQFDVVADPKLTKTVQVWWHCPVNAGLHRFCEFYGQPWNSQNIAAVGATHFWNGPER